MVKTPSWADDDPRQRSQWKHFSQPGCESKKMRGLQSHQDAVRESPLVQKVSIRRTFFDFEIMRLSHASHQRPMRKNVSVQRSLRQCPVRLLLVQVLVRFFPRSKVQRESRCSWCVSLSKVAIQKFTQQSESASVKICQQVTWTLTFDFDHCPAVSISAHSMGAKILTNPISPKLCCDPTSYDEYQAMVKTGNQCQLSAFILLLGTCAIAVCCAEVLFQPSFLPVVGMLHAEWTTEPDT